MRDASCANLFRSAIVAAYESSPGCYDACMITTLLQLVLFLTTCSAAIVLHEPGAYVVRSMD